MTTATRIPLIAGNWKMYKTPREARQVLEQLTAGLPKNLPGPVVVAAPFVALPAALAATEGSPLELAAQNMFWADEGAYTGEIAPGMLTDLGVKWVLVGHSERRQLFKETDQDVNHKVKAALAHGLKPILCLGETLDERESGRTFEVLGRQFELGLEGLPPEALANLVLAYEPVWAIGTGRTATPAQAQEAHAFLRGEAAKMENTLAKSLQIVYGGSVKPDNAAALMGEPDLDGALVGGASLAADSFLSLIKAGLTAKGFGV